MNKQKYYCESCNYGTSLKCDFNRHILSKKHVKSSTLNDEIATHTCDACNKVFFRRQSIYQHKKYCKGNQAEEVAPEQNDMLITIVKKQQEIIERMEQREEKLIKLVEQIKPSTNYINNGTIDNRTVTIQYIMQNYAEAPTLKSLTDDELKNIKYKPNNGVLDCIAYHQRHNRLHKYIAEIIVQFYKKDDPSKQSLWSSDSSRFHYIIMMELKHNNKNWIRDKEGKTVVGEVIQPILQYIKNAIHDFYKAGLPKHELSIDEHRELAVKRKILGEVLNDIDDNHLEDRILKQMSPEFACTITKNNDKDVVGAVDTVDK